MNRLLPLVTLLAVLAGKLSCPAVGTVELNGIACLFGKQYALFDIVLPGQAATSGFMLSEGQSQSGVKLLAVDAAAGRVVIEEQGTKRFLRIASASSLGVTPTPRLAGDGKQPSGGEAEGSTEGADPNDIVMQYQIMSGNPGWGTIPNLSNTSKSDNNSNSGTGPNAGNPNGANPSGTLKDHSQEVWYQESLTIEQNRAATATQVIAGEMPPWPLTPLTPAGTAAKLIGKDGLFASHMPGFLNSSLPNQ